MFIVALKIFAFLFAIFLLVIIHELSHFMVARFFKIKVLRFSIGFGKPLWRHSDKNGIEYVIAPFLLGGYVKLLDTREMEVKPRELHLAFDRQKKYQRFLVLIAGPLANFIFAILAFWLMFVIGFQAPKPIIAEIKPVSIFAASPIVPGDEIIALDGVSVRTWQAVFLGLMNKIGDAGDVLIEVRRGAKIISKPFSIDLEHWTLASYDPDILDSLGIVPYRPALLPRIAAVKKGSVAAKAGLAPNDLILTVNQEKVKDWYDLLEKIESKPKQHLSLTLLRAGNILTFDLDADWKFGAGFKRIGYLGIMPLSVKWPDDMLRMIQYQPLAAGFYAMQESWRFTYFNYVLLKKLCLGKISLRLMGGPISIFKSAGSALEQGVAIYLGFLGLLSVTLAFLNLLPIPALDGGQILFVLIEAIIRRPIALRWQILFYRFGLIVILLIMVQAGINDLMRLF